MTEGRVVGHGRWRSRLAIVLYAAALTSFAIEIASLALPGASDSYDGASELPIWIVFLVYATVGALILVRQPENRVGWLVGAVGFFPMMSGLATVYFERVPDWPLADVAKWYNGWYFVAGVGTLPLLFLLFPDGRPASRLWRWPVLIAATGLAALLLRYMFGPGDCGDESCGAEENPFQPAALRPFLGVLETVGTVGLVAGLVAGAASLAWRFHRARGVERQQVKWLAGAVFAVPLLIAVIVVVSLVWPQADWVGNSLFVVALVLPAVAVIVAVLRYRLYDLDRVVSRTVSYAVLTALLLGVDLALVTASAQLLPDGSSLSVAASTLAAAALFQPLRVRVQRIVDHRFNRAGYDADRTVATFSQQLREQVDLDTVRDELLTVVHAALQPSSADLWLRTGRGHDDRPQ